MANEQKTGFLLAGAAFVFWGLTPVYFKAVATVSPLETVAQRIVWSAVMLAFLLLFINKHVFRNIPYQLRRHGWVLGAGAVLLSINWLVYIYAVVSDRVLEASLGYFINPLVNVALAAVFLSERLTRVQKIAVLLAAVGVLQEVIRFGQFPTLALIMAGSFGIYGLLRKKTHIGGSEGLFIETLLMLPLAAAYLFYLEGSGRLAFGNQGLWITGLLFSAGLITILPLIWFIGAAKRLNYSIIGMMQYVAPTIMGLLGYWVYEEGFPPGRLITFSLVWSGLLLVVIEGVVRLRSRA